MFEYVFMQRALLAGLVIGAVAPAIGTYLVLRRMSLLGDTLAHVSLAGVAASLLFGFYPLLGALGLTVVAATGIERLRRQYPRHSELAVAVTLSGAIGLAVVLISLNRSPAPDLLTFLFGSIVTLTNVDVWLVAAIGAVGLAAVGWLYRDLLLLSFDEELAHVSGLPVRALGLAFALLTAVTVAVAMRLVGVLLVSSLMVLPVAASLQFARSFRATLLWAIVLGEAAVWFGLSAAYYFDLAPGGTVVLVAVAILLLTLLGGAARRRVLAGFRP